MQPSTVTLAEYLESLTITQGQGAGDPLELLDWQREFLSGAFAPGVSEAALSIARGNGKTTLLAGVAAAAIDGPLAVPRGEVVIVASSFTQARLIFEHCRAFLESRRHDFGNRKRWQCNDTANRASIEDRRTGSRIRCIGSDPRRAHGLAPTLVLADEPAQWPHGLRDAMLAALRTSMGKIPGARMIALGTRPADPSHWFCKMLSGGADHVADYAVPLEADASTWGSRSTWLEANPSLDHFPALEAALAVEWERTDGDPDALASFRALRLNQGVADTSTRSLVEAREWLAAEGFADREGEHVWGLDLGGARSMSAIASYWPATGLLECVGCFPRVPGLHERERRDNIPEGAYRRMVGRGELVLLGERVADPAALIRHAIGKWGKPAGLAADRFRQAELLQVLDGLKWQPPIEWRGLGWRDGSEDVRSFRRTLLEARLIPRESLLLRSALAEAVTMADPAGNEKLTKRHSKARDDAAMAAVLAVGAGARHPELSQSHLATSRVVTIP